MSYKSSSSLLIQLHSWLCLVRWSLQRLNLDKVLPYAGQLFEDGMFFGIDAMETEIRYFGQQIYYKMTSNDRTEYE